MHGTIKTYLPEKRYGFIKGDDGKDYYFHQDSLRDMKLADRICEDAFVEFDQKATPKGYKAEGVVLINPAHVLMYTVPADFVVSRTRDVKGWDILEEGQWVVHGRSRHSPDDAKRGLVNAARCVGANAVLSLEYYKATGSEAGTGLGTYYFTIHCFRALVTTIAKKKQTGQYTIDGLLGVNHRAAAMKKELVAKTKRSKWKRFVVWTTVLVLSFSLFSSGQFLVAGALLVIGAIFGRATVYDWWLQEA